MCYIILALLIIAYIIISLVFRKKDRDERESSPLYKTKGFILLSLSCVTLVVCSLLFISDVSLYTCDTAKRTESIIDYNKVTVVSEKTSREYAVVYKTDKGTYQINPDTLNKRSVIFEVSEEPTQVEIEERKSFDICFFIEVTDVTYTFL